MASTSGNGSGGGFFSTLLNDATQVGVSWASAKAVDVQGTAPNNVPGIENGYYGYGSATAAPASSGLSTVEIVGLVGLLAVIGFVALKHLR